MKENDYVSAEYMLAGIGMVQLFKYLCKIHNIEVEENLNGKRIFEILTKEHPLYKVFCEWYLKYLGKYLDTIVKIYLNEGGNLIMGGIIYFFFKKFFNLSTDKFFKKLLKYFFSDKIFLDVYQDVNIFIYSDDTGDFAVQGT